jgi:hypothetical protein
VVEVLRILTQKKADKRRRRIKESEMRVFMYELFTLRPRWKFSRILTNIQPSHCNPKENKPIILLILYFRI